MPELHDEPDLLRLAGTIDAWAQRELGSNPLILAVEHDRIERRWLVRLAGEDKEFITLWLTLRERTLLHEAHVMPAPEESHREVFEHCLRANQRMFGMAFSIGIEEAIYLRGAVPLEHLDEGELDRITGSTWQYVEQHFRALLRTGFASRLAAMEARAARDDDR